MMINTNRKKVLIIDDDIDLLHLVEIVLKSHGFEVLTHSQGFQVAELVESCQPDLILLDIRLQNVLGTAICKELKQSFDIPIVLFSAHANMEDTFKDCNADAFIGKPFEIADFLSVIDYHLKMRA